jgi:hypothetical protein
MASIGTDEGNGCATARAYLDSSPRPYVSEIRIESRDRSNAPGAGMTRKG